MKTWSVCSLALGFILVVLGIVMWETDHRNPPYKLPILVFPFIPGWSLLIMGWTGMAVEGVVNRLRAGPTASAFQPPVTQ